MIGRAISLVGLNPSLQNTKPRKIPKSQTQLGQNHSNLAFGLLNLAPKTIPLEQTLL